MLQLMVDLVMKQRVDQHGVPLIDFDVVISSSLTNTTQVAALLPTDQRLIVVAVSCHIIGTGGSMIVRRRRWKGEVTEVEAIEPRVSC